MTILETLQTDHRQVKVLLETILSTNDAKKRGDVFKQFRTELTAHSRVEEMVLYRRMEKSEEGKDEPASAQSAAARAIRFIILLAFDWRGVGTPTASA